MTLHNLCQLGGNQGCVDWLKANATRSNHLLITITITITKKEISMNRLFLIIICAFLPNKPVLHKGTDNIFSKILKLNETPVIAMEIILEKFTCL